MPFARAGGTNWRLGSTSHRGRLGQVTLALASRVDGDGADTVVFIQGWPDDASLWDAAVAELARDHRCVRTTLPNFDGDRTTRWGYSTEEILDALEAFVSEAARGGKVILVLHDWGSYWGHAVHHRRPELVRAVVGIDVAPHFRPTAAATAMIIAYQFWLFGAFMVGGPIGDAMTRSFGKLARTPAPPSKLTSWMNYPYRNVWLDIFSGRIKKLVAGYWPTCPIFFVYGAKKPASFHSARWLAHVEKVGGEVVALDCDHWVPRDPRFPALLRRWLDALPAT